MFPLGSVLFPAMPLALQVFEERYLKMMGTVLDAEESEFGVVLIERGSEVGGGDQRFDIGTTAQVLQVEAPDGPLQVVARGGRRFRVSKWIEEEPFPRAEVEFLDVFDPGDVPGEELVLTENVRHTDPYCPAPQSPIQEIHHKRCDLVQAHSCVYRVPNAHGQR